MALSPVDSSTRNDIELEPVVNWPLVRLAAILGGIVVAGLIGVVVLAAAQTAQAPQPEEPLAAIRPAPPPRSADRMGKPAEAAEAPLVEAPMWKALAPPPAQVTIPVVFKPASQPVGLEVAPEYTPAVASPTIPSASEHELRFSSELQGLVREIDLDSAPGTAAKLLAASAFRPSSNEPQGMPAPPKDSEKSVVDIMAHRVDLAGLPLRGDSESRLPEKAARSLQEMSQLLRRSQVRADRLDRAGQQGVSTSYVNRRDESLVQALADHKEWLKDEYSPGLAQMLCVETEPVRLQLTKMLAATKGEKASVALARQALFDASQEVRKAAILAMKDRACDEYRQTLLDGLRYPLPAVADRAAEALTALGDQKAVKALTNLLDLPDPTLPVFDEKKHWVVAEVVKVSHLRNCLLCHAPASSDKDPVRGFVPKQGEAIPVAYYAESKGDFVRADVTYLKQDFSVMESVADPGKWPSMQRFDYMVRSRALTEDEVKALPDANAQPAPSYPQRDAVRFALEKLTAAHPVEKVGLGP